MYSAGKNPSFSPGPDCRDGPPGPIRHRVTPLRRQPLSGIRCVLLLAVLAATGLSGQVQHWKPWKIRAFWERQLNPLEFRLPVSFVPFDVKAGLAMYGGPDMIAGLPFSLLGRDFSVASLDSTESEVSTIGNPFRRLLLIYDLDFLQLNLRSRLLPISSLDILAGLAIRTHQIPFAPAVPSHWPSDGTDYRFAPVFHTGLVTLTFGYQRSERLYAYLKTSYGYATGSVYRAGLAQRNLRGTGTAADWALGVKRLPVSSDNPRMALGLELRYHTLDIPSLEIPTLEDGRKLSPVEGLQYRSLGVFITFGAFFGGRPTAADAAKDDLYRGDYMAARDKLISFIRQYPDHAKVKRARKLLALAEKMAPYQQLDLAQAYQARGELEKALRWYGEAEATTDTALIGDIAVGQEEVGYIYLQRASDALQQNDLEATSRILRNANLLLPGERVVVNRFEAEVLIRRGHQHRALGNHTAALRSYDDAIRIDPGRKVEVDGYRVRIAEDLLQDAARAADRSAVALAIESLQLSRNLDPGADPELDFMVVDLQNRLAQMSQAQIRSAIEAQMELAREIRNRVPPTRPRIGMLVAALEEAIGPPDQLTQASDPRGVNHQIWEYRGGDFPGQYYFENYILKRIELAPER